MDITDWRRTTDFRISDNLIHKHCKTEGIYLNRGNAHIKNTGNESMKIPNITNSNWDANGSLQIVISDITIFKMVEVDNTAGYIS